MRKCSIILCLFSLFSFVDGIAQEFSLGKVSIAELEQKKHPKDTTAAAAILFKKGEVKFEYLAGRGFDMLTEVKTRIKIYKKDGYDWANQKVDYYLDNKNGDIVNFSDAVTYNLVAGKIEKTKLKSDGIFNEKIDKYWGQKKITMPNIHEGSVIEFSYTIKSPLIGSIIDWDFQTSIPVNYSEFKTVIPEYFVYKANQRGFTVIERRIEKTNRKVTYIPTVSQTVGTESDYSNQPLSFEETKTTYVATNLPAMKGEAFVNNIDNYSLSISHELSMTNYPNQPTKSYSTDWDAVAKTIYEYDDFGPELNKTGYFENDLKAVIAGLTTEDEIILAILNYVKATVKWNEIDGYSCDNGVRKAYKDKIGNVAEINLMLTAMMRYAGLEANPVLVSTRENGIALFPSRTAFNYVIAAIETDKGKILLDATEKYSLPNILPIRDLNWRGRLIRKNGTSEEIDLMPKKLSLDNVAMMYAIDPTGKITGKLRRQRTDYNAMGFRSKIGNTKEEDYLEKLENENGKIEIADYSRTNEKDIKLPIVENCSFTGANLCEIIGEKMYINPLLFLTKEHNPFKQEAREYPIDYGYPFMDRYNITIDIPTGYAIETLPKSSQIDMLDNIGSFKFISNVQENKIQLSISHQINTPIVPSDYYSMLKGYYQGMIAKQTEKIVLKKV